jgi:hypothetical protein
MNRALVTMLLAAVQFSPARVHHDPTPIHLALWRVACHCAMVRQGTDGSGFFFQPQPEPQVQA